MSLMPILTNDKLTVKCAPQQHAVYFYEHFPSQRNAVYLLLQARQKQSSEMIKKFARCILTNSVSSLPADGRQTLDVGAGCGGGLVPGELCEEVLHQLCEDRRAAAGHQVTEGDDGPLPHCQSGAGELGQQAAQYGRVEGDQSTA